MVLKVILPLFLIVLIHADVSVRSSDKCKCKINGQRGWCVNSRMRIKSQKIETRVRRSPCRSRTFASCFENTVGGRSHHLKISYVVVVVVAGVLLQLPYQLVIIVLVQPLPTNENVISVKKLTSTNFRRNNPFRVCANALEVSILDLAIS